MGKDKKIYSSPNRLLWEYFDSLRELTAYASEHSDDEGSIKRIAYICIIMSVTTVETFINIYFRQLVEEVRYRQHRETTLKELSDKCPLDYKVKNWPLRFFEKNIDFGKGIGQKFIVLKDKRNALMHFSPSCEMLEIENITIKGNTDITKFENLSAKDIKESIETAERFIGEVFRVQGRPVDKIPHFLHSWIGKVPV